MTIRVYIADEHDNIREGLRELLESRSDIVVVGGGADGRQAVTEANELRPDVAIMDIAMPRLNGIEATSLLRASAPSTRVILLSMLATTEYVFRALQAGARGYLLKSSLGAELVDAVYAVHAGRRYIGRRLAEVLADEYLRHLPPSAGAGGPATAEAGLFPLIAEEHPGTALSSMLALSPEAVEACRRRLIHRIGEADPASLVKLAIIQGLVSAE